MRPMMLYDPLFHRAYEPTCLRTPFSLYFPIQPGECRPSCHFQLPSCPSVTVYRALPNARQYQPTSHLCATSNLTSPSPFPPALLILLPLPRTNTQTLHHKQPPSNRSHRSHHKSRTRNSNLLPLRILNSRCRCRSSRGYGCCC